MQYILTEKEYHKLTTLKVIKETMNTDVVQRLCTDVANHKAMERDWEKANRDEYPIKAYPNRPWGCILTDRGGYCDQCPVKKVCPYPHKAFSK